MNTKNKLYCITYSPDKKDTENEIYSGTTYSHLISAEDEDAALAKFYEYAKGKILKIELAENFLSTFL